MKAGGKKVGSLVVGDGEGTLSHALQSTQIQSSQVLRTELSTLTGRLSGSRLKLAEKIKLMAVLVKAHEALTKTERLAAGLGGDRTTVNAGVIVIPEKAGYDSWHEVALAEVERGRQQGEALEEASESEVSGEG